MNGNQSDNQFDEIKPDTVSAERLRGLNTRPGAHEQNFNENYSRFIKRVKFALPIFAFLLIVLIFTWNNFENDKIVAIKEEDVQAEVKQEIGKNELINPKFESLDDKGQPFTLTADKATQENGEQGEMLLENPKGSLLTNNSESITLSANAGIYEQLKQSLNLNENVVLTHSEGYTMFGETLYVDLATDEASSNDPVRVTGPQGTIDANGVKASTQNGTVIFTGPATMLLNVDNNAIQFGAIQP